MTDQPASLDLAVIGNCSIASLIDQRGRHVFTCLPRLDGDPVFCSLLDGGDRGFYEVELEGCATSSQRYLRNTAVVETRLEAADGSAVRIVDFCPRFRQFDRNFRPTMLVRIVEVAAGRPRVRVRLRPRLKYGAADFTVRRGSHHLRYVGDALDLRLTTNASLDYIVEERWFTFERPLTLVLGPDESIVESVGGLGTRFLASTTDYWRDWVRTLAVPFEWQEPVIRAAITLKLCSYEDTGSIVAALTTSIPEAPGSARNWDYRFCWLRDSLFTVKALNRLGATRTMESYLRFILNIAAGAKDHALQPLYGISGESMVVEQVAHSMSGYRGMGPVRIGNAAWEQRQNDAYGAVVLSAMQAFFDERLREKAGIDALHQLTVLGEHAWALHDVPDAGLWEFRTRSEVHTFSAAMCWAALDRIAQLHALFGEPTAKLWRSRADTVRAKVLERGWNEALDSFVDVFGGSGADASLLLLPEIGLVAHDDPRFRSTLEFLERRLRRGDFLSRYDRADDFGAPTVAFNLCTFWYINALAGVGRQEEARRLFESMLARCNHVGLLSEDIDPASGELWGNFPQTYSMVGIINAAMRLSRPWESAL
ncbi:MAG: Trehalase [Steroidobacteraceae bacterium]|nr:Trehalase [Steroidobacteraceae bacterium]